MVQQAGSGIAGVHSASVWVKSNTGVPQTVYLRADTGDTLSSILVTTEWQHLKITGSAGVPYFTIGSRGSVSGVTSSVDILLWHPQTETGTVATTYQLVNTATDYVDIGAPRYLSFDGVDDFMVTNSINFTGTDKMTVWAGVRKLSDAAAGVVCELSASVSANNGAFNLQAPRSGASYGIGVRGSSLNAGDYSTFTAPISTVISASLTTTGSNIGNTIAARFNGVSNAGVANSNAASTGNFGNYPLYIGRRGGTSLPFNGRIYQLIVRGAAARDGQIAAGEAWCNSKARAY